MFGEPLTSDVPALVADKLGFIREVTPAFCHAFEWREQDLTGKPLALVVPGNMQDAHHLGFARFLETGRPTLLGQPLTLPVVRGDGRHQTAELCIDAVEGPDGWVFRATAVPREEPE